MSTVANLTPSQPVCTPYHFCFCARDLTTNEWPPTPLLATHQDLGAGEGAYHLEYYGLYGRLSAELDPHRTRTEYSREQDSLVQHVAIRPAGADAPLAEWDLTLSGEVVVASTNPRHAAAVSYLDVDHVASVTWHDGRAAHYDYDARGNLAAVTDEGGRVSSLTWDYTADPRWGRLVEIQEEDGQPVTFSYSGACSRIETVTCPKPGTTDGSTVSFAFSYNHLGDITSIVGPGNNATSARQVRFEYTDPQHPRPVPARCCGLSTNSAASPPSTTTCAAIWCGWWTRWAT